MHVRSLVIAAHGGALAIRLPEEVDEFGRGGLRSVQRAQSSERRLSLINRRCKSVCNGSHGQRASDSSER